MSRTITAKHNMTKHIRVNGKLELREWVSGKAYEAKFIPGEVTVQSEQEPVIFNGIQQDDIHENFIFWGDDMFDPRDPRYSPPEGYCPTCEDHTTQIDRFGCCRECGTEVQDESRG